MDYQLVRRTSDTRRLNEQSIEEVGVKWAHLGLCVVLRQLGGGWVSGLLGSRVQVGDGNTDSRQLLLCQALVECAPAGSVPGLGDELQGDAEDVSDCGGVVQVHCWNCGG